MTITLRPLLPKEVTYVTLFFSRKKKERVAEGELQGLSISNTETLQCINRMSRKGFSASGLATELLSQSAT